MRKIASLLALPFLLPVATGASAFDCGKATTAVEKAICEDPALKRLDDELGAAYGALRPSLAEPEQKMLALSQKRWIARREACGRNGEELANCAKRLTGERLALLAGEALSGPGQQGRLVPVFIAQEGTPTSYDIDIALLRFAEPKAPGEHTLNRLAGEVAANAKLGPHGETNQSAILARADTFALTYASPTFMSVRHSFYMNEGGAHGNSGTENFNIDMAGGRLLGIRDVLAEPSAALLTLWCKKQIEAEKQKRVPEADLAEGAEERDRTIAARVRDLSGWSIGETEITVSFDPYAVGAYAEGAYECRFPTEGVKRLALPGALIP
jgi:uncharacterized protein YecT (DUF1311 family)